MRALLLLRVFAYSITVLACFGGCSVTQRTNNREPGRRQIPPETIGEIYTLKTIETLSAQLFYQRAGSRMDLYLPYDLKEVLIGKYSLGFSSKVVVTVEVHEFRSPLDAFGIAARLSSLEKERSGKKKEHESHDSIEEIVSHGRHVVLVRSSFLTERNKVQSLAVEVADALPGERKTPREVAILETIVRDRSTITFEPVSVIGSRLLAPALAAPVALTSNQTGTIFLTKKESEEESKAAFEAFISVKTKSRKGVSFILGIGEVACSLRDDAYGWIILSKKGPYIIGLSGIESPSLGWPIVSVIVTSLGE